MTRVSSNSIQQSTIESIGRAQEKMASLQMQLATGKKASTYRELGADTTKTLTARTALDRTQAYQGASKQLTNTLNLYDIKFGQLNSLSDNLKAALAQKMTDRAHHCRRLPNRRLSNFGAYFFPTMQDFQCFLRPKEKVRPSN